jgi:hypothetical protein
MYKYIYIVFVLICTFNASSSLASVYGDTIEQIKKIYATSNNHLHAEFLNLDVIHNNSKFIELLKEMVENKDGILEKINGYYHPVGFVKIVLYKGEKGEQLRLHLWDKNNAKNIKQHFNNGWEPIHNHRWNFSSKVITGGLAMHEYTDHDCRLRFNDIKEAENEVNKVKLGESYKIYDVSIISSKNVYNGYKVIKTGKFAIIGNKTQKFVSNNNAYYLDHRTPHQVKPEQNTSTILLMDPPSKIIASEIFSYKDKFQDEFELQNITPKETQIYAREFLDHLNRSKKCYTAQ